MDEIQIALSKQELTIIFNVLAQGTYNLANARVVQPLVDKLYPLVAPQKEEVKTDNVLTEANVQDSSEVNKVN